jgi:hypothetical protein
MPVILGIAAAVVSGIVGGWVPPKRLWLVGEIADVINAESLSLAFSSGPHDGF